MAATVHSNNQLHSILRRLHYAYMKLHGDSIASICFRKAADLCADFDAFFTVIKSIVGTGEI
jgi:hypothetical protein